MPIRRTEFESGLRVVTERMPGVRSVALGFWVLAGSRDEPPPISGSSHFLEHLLFKGTKTRTARDIAEAFDAVGGDVNAFTAKEYTCFYSRWRDIPHQSCGAVRGTRRRFTPHATTSSYTRALDPAYTYPLGYPSNTLQN